jgi:hypothetical protein
MVFDGADMLLKFVTTILFWMKSDLLASSEMRMKGRYPWGKSYGD